MDKKEKEYIRLLDEDPKLQEQFMHYYYNKDDHNIEVVRVNI